MFIGVVEAFCILGIAIAAGIILFIVFLAWLIGGGARKTDVRYIPQQPIQQPMQQGLRYCPSYGRNISMDA